MTLKLHFDDLTKVTCPVSMLDSDTFRRLDEWPHGYELWNGYLWVSSPMLAQDAAVVLRAKPRPRPRPKPEVFERFLNIDANGNAYVFKDRVGADTHDCGRLAVVKIRWDSEGHLELGFDASND